MYSADLRWTHDSRTSGEQQKALFARPYKYSQVYSTIYDKNVFKYVRISQNGFLYALEACLVNLEQS